MQATAVVTPPAAAEARDRVGTLTERESATLQLVTDGMTNKEIGEQLGYTVSTIKNTVQSVIDKLQVSDRTQAAVMAVRGGLLEQ
jgi:DNA-binding NarL/FixJ family response regulator